MLKSTVVLRHVQPLIYDGPRLALAISDESFFAINVRRANVSIYISGKFFQNVRCCKFWTNVSWFARARNIPLTNVITLTRDNKSIPATNSNLIFYPIGKGDGLFRVHSRPASQAALQHCNLVLSSTTIYSNHLILYLEPHLPWICN